MVTAPDAAVKARPTQWPAGSAKPLMERGGPVPEEHDEFAGRTVMITGGTGSFRIDDPQLLPDAPAGRDPDLQPRREEAGRPAHAAARRPAEVLHWRRARQAGGRQRSARGRLHLPCRGAQAGAELRIPPDGSGPDQCARHAQRARRRHRGGRGPGGLPVDRQGGLPDQRDGHLQGDDGEGDRGQGAHRAWLRYHDLRNALRQRAGQPRFGRPAVRAADPAGPADSPSPIQR